jgi:hypothetical protein
LTVAVVDRAARHKRLAYWTLDKRFIASQVSAGEVFTVEFGDGQIHPI